MILVLIIIILLFIALWNAYVILWRTDINNDKKYSKIWHGIGLIIRVLIMIIPFFFINSIIEDIKWLLVSISIGGIAYDFIINAIRYYYTKQPPLWYVDNKGWNKFFLKFLSAKLYWILRGIFVLTTIIILFI